MLPETELDLVLQEMKKAADGIAVRFDVQILVEEFLRSEAPNATPPDAPVVLALAQAIQEVYGVQARPQGIGGQTVATFFRKRGLPAAVWEKLLHMAHAPNEKISIENSVGDAKVFGEDDGLIRRHCSDIAPAACRAASALVRRRAMEWNKPSVGSCSLPWSWG